MRVLVFGAGGFLGAAVVKELAEHGHEVLDGSDLATGKRIDLLDAEAVETYLHNALPEVIVNCAGIVGASVNVDSNARLTENILSAVKGLPKPMPRVIITGSAAEYGQVADLPVNEEAPFNAAGAYALSKVKEEQIALAMAEANSIDVTIVRLFNAVGPGMKSKFLIPGLLRQIKACQQGTEDSIELSRLDSARDYVDVRDVAQAYRLLIESKPARQVYNIGSGVSTTNGEILEMLIKNCTIPTRPKIVETLSEPEVTVACQAEISRISQEFGWKPAHSLEQTIKDITDATN
jgi:GDP-4-dehydro-6-deoxy-D-mannose reductase